MAGQECVADILACRMRITRLDAAGATPAGATNSIVTEQLVELTATDEVEAGIEVSQPTACGVMAWPPYKGPDTVKWMNIELTMSIPDHEAIEMMTGAGLITDAGNTIGHARPALGVAPAGSGVSIELWSVRLVNGVQDSVKPWIWSVLPRVVRLRQGPRRWFAGARVPTFTGVAQENTGWGNGPTNNWPGPSNRALAELATAIAPPAATCGYVAVPAQV